MAYAQSAKEKILDLTDTYGYVTKNGSSVHEWNASNQAILNLARGGIPYIYAADLLDGYFTPTEKKKFQIWLKEEVYPKVSWASRVRKNNWGVAGSCTASIIADYLSDSGIMLCEFGYNTSTGLFWDGKLSDLNWKEISTQDAFTQHNDLQVKRMSAKPNDRMDSPIPDITVAEGQSLNLWGILANGAIPDELRRGANGTYNTTAWVTADYILKEGSGFTYTLSFLDHLIAHAEFLRRRGITKIYDHVENDGSASLLKAIKFVINNPIKSYYFTDQHSSALFFAYDYYKDTSILYSIKSNPVQANIDGQRMAVFGPLIRPITPTDYSMQH